MEEEGQQLRNQEEPLRLEEREETGLEAGHVEPVGQARVWEPWAIPGGLSSRGSSMEGLAVVKHPPRFKRGLSPSARSCSVPAAVVDGHHYPRDR